MAADLPEAFLGDRSVPLQPLSHAFDPTGPTLQQRWPCSAAPAGLLIFTLPPLTAPSSPLACTPLFLFFFPNPHLKRQCVGFFIPLSPSPHCCSSTDRGSDGRGGRENAGRVLRRRIQGETTSLKVAVRGLGWVGTLATHVWALTLPLLMICEAACLAVSECVCSSVPAYATVPKYICFSASCQSEATLLRTPTVARGAVISFNATAGYVFQEPWTKAGPANTDMVNSACFSLYFQDTASETPIQRQYLDITRLENESQANSHSGGVPSMNRLQTRARAANLTSANRK